MPLIKVADDGGDTITVLEHNGYLYPNFPNGEKRLKNFPAIGVRPDDIFICAYPKSGTHWTYEIVRLLVAGNVDTKDVSKEVGMLELMAEESYKNNPSPRILNTHLLFKHLPEQVKTKKPKIIYIDRNPKDVTVSFYPFLNKVPGSDYRGKWENFVKPLWEGKFPYGSWFDYVKEWEEAKKTTDVPILSLHYEDMKEDLFREIKRITDFLGLERSDDFLKEVCKACDFSTMKKTKATGSHYAFRKGQVGDWMNNFTVAQNELFDQLYQERMQDCPMTFRYTL